MVKVKYKHFNDIQYRNRFPRKIKKAILGLRISSSALNRKIKSFDGTPWKVFCPKCGCGAEYMVDHGVQYPEIWRDWYCYRCHHNTATADNSAYHHVLMKDD